MVDQAFNRTVLYPLEKPLADDLNQDSSQGDRSIRDTMYGLLNGQSGFLLGGFKAVASTPVALSVVVNSGLGFQDAPTDTPAAIGGVLGVNDLSRYKPLILANNFTVPVPAAPGANSRIDLIEVRYNRVLDNPQSRNFLDPATDAFSPATVPKTLDFNVDNTLAYYAAAAVPTTAFAYKSGVVAGSPTPPAVDAGYMAIAYITVGTSVTVINAGDISDQRPGIVIASGARLARQIISANGTYTPTRGTKSVLVRVCGGGGGGGGAQGTANGAAGSGGASGTTIELDIVGAPNITGGAVVIGAGGTGGASSANGTDGGDTTIVIDGVTYTAKGGGHGIGSLTLAPPSVVRGGAPIAGSSASVATSTPGYPGINNGNAGSDKQVGGSGGCGALGIGGQGGHISENGTGGTGFGSGGGGAAEDSGAGKTGGAGAAGVVIIDEYA